MNNAAIKLEKVISPLSTYLAYFSSFLALSMAIIVAFDITIRTIFNKPILGIIELETFMLATLCFLSLSYTMIKEGHVRVDIFFRKLPGKMRVFDLCGWYLPDFSGR